MNLQPKKFLPVEIVFHPNWWNKNFNIEFGWDYFFEPKTRVKAEQQMIKILYEKFGQFGYGEANPKPEPIIGPVHLAAGFITSAIWGCDIIYCPDSSPQVVCKNTTIDELDTMDIPDPTECKEFAALVKLINKLKEQYGYVIGDINWSGLQNLALDLMGQDLFLAYIDSPNIVHMVYEKLNKSIIEIVNYIRNLTDTSSVSVNRSIINVDPTINLNSNCSVQMISNQQYETFILPYEKKLSKELQPYGVHHCGNNMHTVAEGYSKIPDCCFFDIGWGADIARCRRLLPDAFFNVRLSPVKIKDCTPDEVKSDIERLFSQVGDLSKVGLCCINMDYGTPDENVAAIFETTEKYTRIGT